MKEFAAVETAAATDEVLVRREGRILVITLNRPHARNAATQAMAAAVAAALDELDADDELSVGIITGGDGSFCAGMDLKGFLRGERPIVDGRGFLGLTQAPPAKPLIAAVEGYALAGGCEAVLACDLVVASETAKFGLPEVKRGLVAAAGGLLRLPHRIPWQIAMELALTGEMLDAEGARQIGLVNHLTEEGKALDRALELAARIADNGPLAVIATKKIIVEHSQWPEPEKWSRQRAIIDPVMASEDAKEGARAFVERRRPNWRAR